MRGVTFRRLETRGRWGNQAYQIAASVGLARRYGVDPVVLPSWSYRWAHSLPESWYRQPGPDDVEFDTLPDLDFIPVDAREYGQALCLFDHAADEIRAAFAPSPKALETLAVPELDWYREWCSDGDVLAIHARRGDIVNLPEYAPLVTADYYRRSLDLFPDHRVVAFSDDPQWVAEVLAPELDRPIRVLSVAPLRPHVRGEYVNAPPTDVLDVMLMAEANAHCLSNSTFAFWGAWLAGDTNAVYPSVWHGERRSHIDWRLMLEPTWREVPV